MSDKDKIILAYMGGKSIPMSQVKIEWLCKKDKRWNELNCNLVKSCNILRGEVK